jgi:hypothetical protein
MWNASMQNEKDKMMLYNNVMHEWYIDVNIDINLRRW